MRREERKFIKWGLIAGGIAGLIPVLYLTFLFVWGMQVAGPRPVAETRPAPPLVQAALWARANGGTATELRSINPVSMVQHVMCLELNRPDTNSPEARDRHAVECAKYLPALGGIEHLAALHLEGQNVKRASFRGGAGAMATTFWMTRSWTREDFVNTLAAWADFGNGWRGVDAAAQGYYGRAAGDLTLPQAALVASRISNLEVDPWCHPVGSTARRDSVLRKMRAGEAIDEAAVQAALQQPLDLAPPPAGRPPCQE